MKLDYFYNLDDGLQPFTAPEPKGLSPFTVTPCPQEAIHWRSFYFGSHTRPYGRKRRSLRPKPTHERGCPFVERPVKDLLKVTSVLLGCIYGPFNVENCLTWSSQVQRIFLPKSSYLSSTPIMSMKFLGF